MRQHIGNYDRLLHLFAGAPSNDWSRPLLILRDQILSLGPHPRHHPGGSLLSVQEDCWFITECYLLDFLLQTSTPPTHICIQLTSGDFISALSSEFPELICFKIRISSWRLCGLCLSFSLIFCFFTCYVFFFFQSYTLCPVISVWLVVLLSTLQGSGSPAGLTLWM